jgi:hypothetical protein
MIDKYIEIDSEAIITIIGFVGCISLLATLII